MKTLVAWKRLLAFGGALVCLAFTGCSAGTVPTGQSDVPPAASGADATPERTSRTITATSAAWVTPTGGVSCRGDATSIRCEPTASPSWTLDKPAGCTAEQPTALRLREAGVDVDCSTQSTIGAARLGTGLTSWWTEGRDPQIRVGDVPQAALGYGSTIQIGSYVCTTLQVGVACADTRTGHGFEMSMESVTVL